MNRFGKHFRLALWGESHGAQMGITLDGIPAGIPLSEVDFEEDMARRRSGAAGTTPRQEEDRVEILSGLYRGHTTGAPLTLAVANHHACSEEYAPFADHFRPSHADWVADHKFQGWNDPRGGGHFSGRLTALLVAAGVVAKKILPPKICFTTTLAEVGGCSDPTRFEALLAETSAQGDSLGGVVACRVEGVPAGLGEPFFDAAESVIAHLLFAIPGVKGVEFGSGFTAATMRGSAHNDPILNRTGECATNHAGGINGGITNANPLCLRVAFKPAASIAQPQVTYNRQRDRVEPLTIAGRHDCCIALRGAVVVEASVAIALAELLLSTPR